MRPEEAVQIVRSIGNEHPVLSRAEHGYKICSGLEGRPREGFAAAVLAGVVDGYYAGAYACIDWLKAREYDSEAEALEKSLPPRS